MQPSFPHLDDLRWTKSAPGPYERQMGRALTKTLELFAMHVPDSESNGVLCELSKAPTKWSAGHAVYDELRRRYLLALADSISFNEQLILWQYSFEEACAQSMYNATDPVDPFDSSAPFYVWPMAFTLATELGVSSSDVVAALSAKR
jgi:hypothetical protein